MAAGALFPHVPSVAQNRAIPPECPAPGEAALESASPLTNAPGLLLTTTRLEPVYANAVALQILGYPSLSPAGSSEICAIIRRVLRADHFMPRSTPSTFLSGRRQYLCRAMLLDSRVSEAQTSLVALLFERRPRDGVALSELSRRFRLSPRESETVLHLVHGLTTKEVARQMSVSPNTVKQFVRIAMSKLGVTTRSGIVGKVLGS